MESTKIFWLLKIFLPVTLRHFLTRRYFRVSEKWPAQLVIKLAQTETELAAAFRLLHDSNVKAGYMKPQESKLTALPQHMLPQTSTIIALWQGSVVGTATLIRDNPFGLPIDKQFNLSKHRAAGKRLAEVSCLALDPRFRGKLNFIMLPLFRYLYHYARHRFGTHELVITVPSWRTDLYEAVFGFKRVVKSSKRSEVFNGARVVGLYLGLADAEDRWKKIAISPAERTTFLKYVKDAAVHSGNMFPPRNYLSSADPILSPVILRNLFLEKAQLSRILTNRQIMILRNVYAHPSYNGVYADLFPEFLPPPERDIRIDVRMPAQVISSKAAVEIWNASMGGAMLSSKRLIPAGETIDLWVQLNGKTKTQLKAIVRWNTPTGLHGLKVLYPSNEWIRMINHLEEGFQNLAVQTAA